MIVEELENFMKVRQTTCPSLTCRGVIPLESRFCMWCGTAIPPDARLPVHDLLDRLEKGDWTEALDSVALKDQRGNH